MNDEIFDSVWRKSSHHKPGSLRIIFLFNFILFYAKMKILQNRKSNMRLKALNDVPN